MGTSSTRTSMLNDARRALVRATRRRRVSSRGRAAERRVAASRTATTTAKEEIDAATERPMFSLERRQRLVRTSSNANGPLSLFQGATPSRRASLSLSITMQFVESAILGVRALRRRRRLRRRFGRRRLCGYEAPQQSSHPKRISMRTYPPLGYPSNVSSPLYRLSRVCIAFFFCLKAEDAILPGQ